MHEGDSDGEEVSEEGAAEEGAASAYDDGDEAEEAEEAEEEVEDEGALQPLRVEDEGVGSVASRGAMGIELPPPSSSSPDEWPSAPRSTEEPSGKPSGQAVGQEPSKHGRYGHANAAGRHAAAADGTDDDRQVTRCNDRSKM